MSGGASGSNNPLRPMSSFQPASTLPRDMNSGPASSSTTGASSSSTTSGTRAGGVAQPRPRPLIRGAVGTGSTILVNNCQRGNPLLQHIRHVGWEYADIVPDYQVGVSSCILFLSIRYHRLHPEYVHTRIAKLGQMYTLRVLLVLCDVNDHQAAIKELTKTALINGLTMLVAWTAEEAGRYVETYKSFEHRAPDAIKERIAEDFLSQATNVLTQVRGVNKTDVVTLLSRFGSVKGVVSAERDELGMCPGFGEVKAKRLRDVFTQPFRVGETRSYKQRKSTTSTTSTTTATTGGTTPTSNPSAMTVGTAQGALEDTLLTTSSTRTTTPTTTTTAAATTSTAAASAAPTRALDALQDSLLLNDNDNDDNDDSAEQEQLRLALQLSMNPDQDS